MIELRLLGPTELTRDGVSVASVLAQPKRLALLVYLVLVHPGGFTRRDQLGAVFWPESDDARARNALRQALHQLRKSLGSEFIVSRGEDEVGIVEGLIRVDALELQRTAGSGDAESVLRLVRGTLMEGFHLAGASSFGQWLDGERRRLRRVAWKALLQRATELEAADEPRQALPFARAASDQRPLEEASARCLIRILEKTGDRAAALARYARLAADFESEFQTEVSPETLELGQRLRAESRGLSAGTRTDGVADGPSVDDPASPRGGPQPRRSQRQRAAVQVATAAAVLVVAAAAISWRSGSGGDTSLPEGAEIVLADPAGVDSNDAIRALHLWFRTELQASEAITLVSRGRIRETLRRMDRDPSTVLVRPLAMEVARRNGHAAVLNPAFSTVGDGWVLAVEAYAPDTPEPLLFARQTAPTSDELPAAVERLARGLRERLGEARSAIRQTAPLPDVTTSSFEALQAYALGEEELQRSIWVAAVNHFTRAVELDPFFALAWARLGTVHLPRQRNAEAMEAFQQAWSLRHRLPPDERPEVEFQYHYFARGDLQAARVVSDNFVELYPDRRPRWMEHQLLLAASMSDWEAGARHARALLESETDFDAGSWWLIVGHLLAAEDDDAALEALDRWQEEDGRASDATDARFRVAWERTDWAEVSRLLEYSSTSSHLGVDGRHWILFWRSYLALARGRVLEGDRLFEDWIAERGGDPGPVFFTWRALADLHVGRDTVRARLRLAAARSSADTQTLPLLAGAYAELGNPAAARQILDRYEASARGFEGWSVRRGYQSALSAILLAEGRVDDAVRAAREGVNTPLGGRADCEACPALALARALDRAGREIEAIALYERVVNARWIISPQRHMDAAYLVPVHERLALLYAAQGRPADARRHNLEIVRLFSGGDEVARPWVQAAEGRLAALSGDSQDVLVGRGGLQ